MTLPRPLLWMPGTAEIPGGHLVQLKETARALEELGCEVRQSLDRSPSLADIDIVHGFGLSVGEIRMCREQGLPVVISTIYWDMTYRYGGGPPSLTLRSLAGRLKRAGRFTVASLRDKEKLVKACMAEVRNELVEVAVLSAADVLLPNAAGEARSVENDLHVGTVCRVVPNGVDPERFTPGSGAFDARDAVLYVGRVEPRKNQLGLLEALRDSGLRVVIAGFPHPHHSEYLNRCRAASAGWAEMVEGPSTEDLVDLYRSARVHVLPSWFETTGLVSLEAGLCGCNIVSTDRGYAREYLGDLAWYCDPGKPATILSAVQEAWGSPPQPELRERILTSYTWRHVAEATVAAYQEALTMHTKH